MDARNSSLWLITHVHVHCIYKVGGKLNSLSFVTGNKKYLVLIQRWLLEVVVSLSLSGYAKCSG